MGIFDVVKQMGTPISGSVLLDCGYYLHSDCEPEDGSGPRVAGYTKAYPNYYISVVGVYDDPVRWTARMVIPDLWSFYSNRDPHYHETKQIIEYESDLIAFETLCQSLANEQ